MTVPNTSFLDACAGKKPERTPIWLMRQAGRYLPEYRAIRAKHSFLEVCRTPELAAEVTVQPIDRFDLDAAILFSDILVVFDAMGVEVEFNPAPVIPKPVRQVADIDRLRFGDPEVEISYVMEAVKACLRALDERVPLIGFCGAPFTVLSYLIEGGGSRDFLQVKRFLFTEPSAFDRLIEQLTELTIAYLAAQVRAGVQAVQVFDSWAGALSPIDYQKHVLPMNRRIVEAMKKLGVPVILFARGNANLLSKSAQLGADVVGVDWSIDMADAIELVGPDQVVQGNLDPGVLLGSEETLVERTRQILQAGKKARSHIFNLGHGISKESDPARVQLLVDTVHGH